METPFLFVKQHPLTRTDPGPPQRAYGKEIMNSQQVFARIEKDAPLPCAASWDTSGIQVKGTRENISRIAVALDPTPETVRQALDAGADLILTHHPLGLTPRFPNRDDDLYQTLALLMRSGVWLYAAHTSLDSQPDGPPAWLAKALDLHDTHVLETTGTRTSLLIRLHAPAAPGTLSHPKIIRSLPCAEAEEFVVWSDDWQQVREDLQLDKKISYHAIALSEPSFSFGFGCIGDLEHPMDWPAFTSSLAGILGKDYWTRIGTPPEQISRVAYCPGSGASLASEAFSLGAQVYITGDVKYHQALEMESAGLTLDVGHHVLEEKMMQTWHRALQRDLESHGVELFFVPGRDPLCTEPSGRSAQNTPPAGP